MPELVTLDEAKALLHIDFDDDDAEIDLYIRGASKSVLRYLKSEGQSSFYDVDTDTLTATVPENVKVATIMLVRIYYDDEENEHMKIFAKTGYMPDSVANMLYQMRDPALA